MDRIAIISDIHGNLEALKAVINDIKSRNIDQIICLGDLIAKGVHIHECIHLIQENCQIVLKGNCDEYFSKDHDLSKIDNETEKKRIEWALSQLTSEEKYYLLNLPMTYEFYMSGSLVRLCHAAPYSPYKFVGMYADLDEWYKMFTPTEYTSSKIADVVIYGHLHIPLSSHKYNKTLINSGSVGNSNDFIRNEKKDGNVLETARACYLIIEGELGSQEYKTPFSFSFIKVPYDIDKELNNDLYNPEKEEYELEIRDGKYRDMTKVYEQFKKDGLDINMI